MTPDLGLPAAMEGRLRAYPFVIRKSKRDELLVMHEAGGCR